MWPTATIGELCDMVKGHSPTMKTAPGDYPFVVTAEARRTADGFQLVGPAVCVPLISSTGHGHASMHRVHYQEGRFALADLLVALLPKDPGQLDCRYLYWLLTARKDDYFVPLMQGTANVSLKIPDIASVGIPVPTLVEQKRIVAMMDQLATHITTFKDVKSDASALRERLMLTLLRPMILRSPKSPLGSIAPIVRRPVEVLETETYPEVGVRSFGKGTFHKPALAAIDVGSKRLFQIRTGDLLFSNVFAWEGAIAVAQPQDHGRYGSHRFITCVPIAGVATPEYLCSYFLTPEGLRQIGEASPGGAGRNRTLGVAKLEEIYVPVPPYPEQVRFTKLLAKLNTVGKLQTQVTAEVDGLLPRILDRAFKGEL